MRVKDLIAKLSKYDPSLEVVVSTDIETPIYPERLTKCWINTEDGHIYEVLGELDKGERDWYKRFILIRCRD